MTKKFKRMGDLHLVLCNTFSYIMSIVLYPLDPCLKKGINFGLGQSERKENAWIKRKAEV